MCKVVNSKFFNGCAISISTAFLFVVHNPDTIVALSTPLGRSGIGVIRLSGPQSIELTRTLLQSPSFTPEPLRVTLRSIYDPESGDKIDQALITYFKAPHSFTGEDVIEVSCHGSPILLTGVIDALLRLGARVADPGEFTLRSLVNGKMNLSQAEAVKDLIDAQTRTAVKQAARQLSGELSSYLQSVKNQLIEIIVQLESSLEFLEDDLPKVKIDWIDAQLTELCFSLTRLANTYQSGRLLKDGLKVTLVGRPNVGKSSVFNSLLVRERAIVTSIPGTTRDSLSEMLSINGIPVLLTDTAGVRKSTDPIEIIGIERTRNAIADADIIVVVLDGSCPLEVEDHKILEEVIERTYLIAINKSDLINFDYHRDAINGDTTRIAYVSALTGDGMDHLRLILLEPLIGSEAQGSDFLITNARHFDLLNRAVNSLDKSKYSIKLHISEDLILSDLYNALNFIGEITGESTPDHILGRIFSTFCIGK